MSIMGAMMPYMIYIVWAGEAAIVAGALAFLWARFADGNNPTARSLVLLSGRIAAGAGVFFLACQAMGMMLGAHPAINFGDATKFEFIMVAFWQIGAVGLVAGIVLGYLWGRVRGPIFA
jgi:hypothetical protein